MLRLLVIAFACLAVASGCSSPQYAAREMIQEEGGQVVWEEGKILQIHLDEVASAADLLSRLPPIDSVGVLNLSGTDVTNQDVQRLPDWPLETLSLRGTGVTEVCLPRILRFSKLETLILSETDMQAIDGVSSLPKLEVLALPPSADDAVLEEVGRCTALHTLYASSTQISGPGLAHCSEESLPRLKTLYLDQTLVDDEGLIHLPIHPNLERVTLQGTQVGDGAAAYLSTFPRIDFLDFSRTQLTDAGLAELAELPLLYILDLDGSQVTVAAMKRVLEKRPDLRLTHRNLTPLEDDRTLESPFGEGNAKTNRKDAEIAETRRFGRGFCVEGLKPVTLTSRCLRVQDDLVQGPIL